MTPRELLVKMRERLTPPGAWTQRAYARDAGGRTLLYQHPDATCFCLAGAMLTCAPYWTETTRLRAMTLLDSLCGGDFVDWNDKAGRTQADVLELLDKAIVQAAAAEEAQP